MVTSFILCAKLITQDMLCPCPQLAVIKNFLPYCKTDQPFSHNSNRDDFKQAVEHFSCSQNQGETWFVWLSVCCVRECEVIQASVTRPVAWPVDISGLNSGYCVYSCPSQDSGKPCSVTCPSLDSGKSCLVTCPSQDSSKPCTVVCPSLNSGKP